MTTLSIEYRARRAAHDAARAALAFHDVEFDTYQTDAREALVRALDRAFYDLEDLRAALRPNGSHRGAYIGHRTGEAGAGVPNFHRAARWARQLRRLLLSGVRTLPRRPVNHWAVGDDMRPRPGTAFDLGDFSPLWGAA